MTAKKSVAAKSRPKLVANAKKGTRPRGPSASQASAPKSAMSGFTNDRALNFLQSRLGALSRSRDEATGAVAEGLGKFADSIGLRKLEDVFDQRVASALERMGIPTARELARLREQVETLSRSVGELKSRQKK